MRYKSIFWRLGIIFSLIILIEGKSQAGITIGAGTTIGTDHAGNTYHEEFQDWAYTDLRALDASGSSDMYQFSDGYDNSRDLCAFYSRQEGDSYYFRVDLYDLTLNAENGYLDIYVLMDFKTGGNPVLPNFTTISTNRPWDLAVCVYDSVNYKVALPDNSSLSSVYLGSYFNSELDSIEFGIKTSALATAGWNGSDRIYFQVYTAKDFQSNIVADAIGDNDRGYTSHIIYGSFADNTTAGRAKYASIAHGNQSINKAADIQVHIWDPSNSYKTGFIRTLDTHRIFHVPLNIHMSGSLIAAAQWAVSSAGSSDPSDGPSFLSEVAKFVDNDQADRPGSLIGGVFSEHIMPYFEGEANRNSIKLFDEISQRYFNLTASQMSVMHVPERVIRNYPTGLSPLTGYTFADITAGGYQACYLDEVTHYHWWFDSTQTQWSGNGGSYDAPTQHKLHKVNGVYCFLINDREDQAKFGPYDSGLNLDTRYTLLDKALQSDQAQLTLVFDDWEALAGKSFDSGSGTSAANNNQIQYQQTIRWIANHQWIEMVNLKDILDRAINSSNSQYNSNWVVDQGTRNDLSMQNYEWLKHATEGTYDYWYYNQSGAFTGNEQDFYNLVPVITGNQGDYHYRGVTPASDGPALPSSKKLGDMNSSGTLIHDSWAALAAAPENSLKKLAEYSFQAMIFETAWHEEDMNDYHSHNYQSWTNPDTTWDGVNTWALKLQNHIRNIGALLDAAQWVQDCKTGSQGSATSVEFKDIDQDGENEYILKNNKYYACFEKYGGRMIYLVQYDSASQDGITLIGSPASNPSAPGEEEYTGTSANRCSGLKDTYNGTYADLAYSVTSSGHNTLILTFPDGYLSKSVTLPDGQGKLQVAYTETLSGSLYIQIGASPNNLDLIKYGRTHLSTAYSAGNYYGVTNSQGGELYVSLNQGASYNPSPYSGGFENRNLSLTEIIEIYGNGSFSFDIGSQSQVPVELSEFETGD
jgi:hypothetical protein